ncbi:competence/damage-inducible protein A [Phycisphaerales bacterium AB-hyl4]|uniref:CinA-like protein n=1 Tax=Natronomicrosphaera hydrolytica TaxID=3242702 RepID=A0ABV4U1Y1_9BACT
MHAIILSIGDELVLGQTVDTNSAWLGERLATRGIPVRYHHTLADDRDIIAEAIRHAADRAELVLITGGLGPTDDDLTRQALADAMNVQLVEDAASVEAVESHFTRRGREMPERNRVQALHPVGSTIIENHNGTAPGITATLGNATIHVMPGVPREMRAMFRDLIEPTLTPDAGQRHVILTTKLNTFGAGESTIADMLGPLMDRQRNPKVGTTVSDGIVSIRLRAEFPTTDEAEQQLDDTLAQVHEKLGALAFGREDQTLANAVVELLTKRGQRLVTAESCTGGLISKMLTDVGGSSMAYVGGWVTYSNLMKMEQLDVAKDDLDTHGAVSETVARAMAEGALRHVRPADVSLAVTGIAGPDGGTPDKPVGTVWLAMARREERQPDTFHTRTLLLALSGDRDAVRDRAAKSALQLLRLDLMDQPWDLIQWAK